MLSHLLHLILSVSLTFSHAQGAVIFPEGLSRSDRENTLKILGAGTSAKLLGDPYPLGGYPGIEVGYSFERIPIQDLEGLGAGTASQNDLHYSKLSLGKGLYNDIDIFLEFMPYGVTPEFSSVGGSLRWRAYQAPELPFSLTGIMHANTTNFANQLTTQSFALELFGSVHLERVALYGGVGRLQVGGRFIGGTEGITDSGETEKNFITLGHNFFGISYRIHTIFAAVQVDRYQRSTVSGKIGLRF